MTRARLVLLLLAMFGLSACGGGADEAASERKTAAGEVLGGTISDAMLPLDTVQSQSPPLREKASDNPPTGESRDPAAATGPAAAAVPESPAEPSASPTPDAPE